MKHIMTKICLATFHHKYKSFKTLSDILHFPGNSKIFLNWQDGYTDRHGGKLLRCVCNISILIRRAYQISSSNKNYIRHLVSCQKIHSFSKIRCYKIEELKSPTQLNIFSYEVKKLNDL